jgi:hypothetical protein
MRLPPEVVAPRAVNVWAVGLLLTFVGMAVAVGVWFAAVALGAPALGALAIAIAAGLVIGAAIGSVLRWLTT